MHLCEKGHVPHQDLDHKNSGCPPEPHRRSVAMFECDIKTSTLTASSSRYKNKPLTILLKGNRKFPQFLGQYFPPNLYIIIHYLIIVTFICEHLLCGKCCIYTSDNALQTTKHQSVLKCPKVFKGYKKPKPSHNPTSSSSSM